MLNYKGTSCFYWGVWCYRCTYYIVHGTCEPMSIHVNQYEMGGAPDDVVVATSIWHTSIPGSVPGLASHAIFGVKIRLTALERYVCRSWLRNHVNQYSTTLQLSDVVITE